MNTYYIRYNVEHKHGDSDIPWRVFETESKFYLTHHVEIKVPTWTAPTAHPDGSTKYSVYCTGTMTQCDLNRIVIE